MPRLLYIALLLLSVMPAVHGRTPGDPGVDAPELARLGTFAVGVRTIRLVQNDQPDVLAFDTATGSAPRRERTLKVDVWYPAREPAHARAVVYTASLPAEPPAAATGFSVPGIAFRNAPPAGTGFPLVIVSHGYSNATAALTWLTENLASKGWVVAAIRHEDPPITDPAGLPQLLLRRPLDIAFVTEALQRLLGGKRLVDPNRVALIGYSMGGYGVLTVAGAALDPAGEAVKKVPGNLLLPYAAGGELRANLKVKGLRAVVAMAPAGGGSLGAWTRRAFKDIDAPLLLISGDADRTVDYTTGARLFFSYAVGTVRYLLTFRGCGHAIGLNPAPDSMRGRLWDQDWFEDPVWRKERIIAINLHFITAFLDRYVKDDHSRDDYLNVRTPVSNDGAWPQPERHPYDAYSPDTGEVTVWKGFQRNHAAGLELLRADLPPVY